MTEQELQRVLDWTKEKLATGNEPPWAWFQYMKLQENLEAIISGIQASKLPDYLSVVEDDIQMPM